MPGLLKISFLFLMLSGTILVSNGAVYEAETGKLYHAVVEDKNSGYTGNAYVNFDNESGSFLEMTVGMKDSGMQILVIRYANGTAAARPMEIRLNDSTIFNELNFEPTDDWTQWDTIQLSVSFQKGINYLKFISTGSEGGPNIDHLEITGEQLSQYQLDLTVDGAGTILQEPEKGPFFEGMEITLVARPDYNTVFRNWTGDFSSDDDTIKFIMDSDITLVAHFVEIEIYPPDPDFSMTGYATVSGEGVETTTGGEKGMIRVIENLDQLIAWGASREDNYTPETIIIKGYIEAETTTVVTIKRGKDISILGDSESGSGFAELKNISLNIRDYSNVIVRNLKMHEAFYPDDDLTIDNCHHVWIDHCEFYSKIGPGIGVDTYDGLLDIKKGSRNVTVSWCYFHDHMKTLLIGHSDNNGEQDVNLEVTMHHNWFSNTDGRNPSLRFGKVHYFNNYLENITDYGFAVRNGAHAKIENCHFESVIIPVVTDKFEGHGYACISGCIYSGSCTENANEISEPFDCGFWDDKIPYSYSLENTNTVKYSVQNYAGVGIISTITGTSEIKKNENFELGQCYFNKSSKKLNVLFSSTNEQKAWISVASIDGKIIYYGLQNVLPGSNHIQVSLKELIREIYMVSLYNSKEKQTKKVVY